MRTTAAVVVLLLTVQLAWGLRLGATTHLDYKGDFDLPANETLQITEQLGAYGWISTTRCANLRGNLSFILMDNHPVTISPRIIIDATCVNGGFANVELTWSGTMAVIMPWMPYQATITYHRAGKVYLTVESRTYPWATTACIALAGLSLVICIQCTPCKTRRLHRGYIWGSAGRTE